MGRWTNAAKVGLFTVVSVGAGVFVYRFADKTTGTGDGYTVYLLMSDSTGIAKHSHVRMAGIPVGNIQDIYLQDGLARIDIRMKPDVTLYEDAAATKVTSSLLGEYFIGLSPGTRDKPELEDGDQIKNIEAVATTDSVIQDVSEIAHKINRIADSLAQSIGTEEGKQNMQQTLANLAAVTEALNGTVRENRKTIRNILVGLEGITTEGRHDVRQILTDVKVVTGEVRELVVGSEGKPGQSTEVKTIIDKINNASTSLENTLANLENASDRLERGEGTLGRLSKDEKLVNDIEDVTEGVGDFVSGLNRLQTIVSLRTDYQFRTQSVKSFVELRLQPREDKYYSFEFVNDPRGFTRIEQIDVDTTNPNDPAHYREVRSVTSNQFRFSMQFAQRFGPFTGRFGIKESTGGVGLDTLLFDDAFELQQDLFGFGEVVRPRWRASIGYAFFDRLWLLGGADDIIASDRRDYFVGLQLRFNDEDLKALLPFAPSP